MSDKNFDCKSQRTIRLNGRVSGMQERAREDMGGGGGIYESEREREKKEEKDRKGVQTEKQDMIRELEELEEFAPAAFYFSSLDS